jgi:GAF domain-containing protein
VDVTTLVLIVLSIVVHLTIFLFAVRMAIIRQVKLLGPWAVALVALGIILLQRILVLITALQRLSRGGAALMVQDVAIEAAFVLFSVILLWSVVQVVKLVVEQRRGSEAAEQRAARLELISRISSLIGSTASKTKILQIAADELAQALKVDLCVLALIDESGEWAEVLAAHLPPGRAWVLDDRIPVFGNPIAQDVLQSQGPVVVNDATTDPRLAVVREIGQLRDARSLLVVPLLRSGRVIGAVGLCSLMASRTFATEEIELAQTIANYSAMVLERARLFEVEQERVRMAEALSEIASILTSTLDLDLVLNLVLDCLSGVVTYDSSAIFLRQDEHLVLRVGRGFPEDAKIDQFSFEISDSALQPILTEEGQPMVIPDVRNVERFRRAEGDDSGRSWIGAPLWARGKLVGLLTMDHSQPGTYHETDAKKVMNFANQAAIVIENAQLFEEQVRLAEALETQNKELIETQQKLIEAERLAVIGQVGLTVRHEINNPLTSVLGLAQWLLSEHPDLPLGIADDLRTIERMAIRIRDIVNKLEDAEYRTVTYMGDAVMLDLHGQEDKETTN